MAKILATPAKGMRVRKPDGAVLNPDGEQVERDSFWLRRERDGDVTLSAVPEMAAEPLVEEASADAGAASKTTIRKGA